jgi:hypothetical protein
MDISQQNLKLRLLLWFAFATASLLAFCVGYSSLFYIVFQVKLKLLTAIWFLCVILAAAILVYDGFRLWPVLGVLFGLIIGPVMVN